MYDNKWPEGLCMKWPLRSLKKLDLSNGVIQKQPIRDPDFDSSLENSLIQQLETKIQGPSPYLSKPYIIRK